MENISITKDKKGDSICMENISIILKLNCFFNIYQLFVCIKIFPRQI